MVGIFTHYIYNGKVEKIALKIVKPSIITMTQGFYYLNSLSFQNGPIP